MLPKLSPSAAFCSSSVPLYSSQYEQPRALELRHVQQLDELGAHFGQAEGRRQMRDVQLSDLSKCRTRR